MNKLCKMLRNTSGWFRRNNTIVAQAKNLSRQLQEAWDENLRQAAAHDWMGTTIEDLRRDRDYISEQLHRVTRERYEERSLKQAASKTAAKLAVELAETKEELDRFRKAYEKERVKRDIAEDALLEYHLDKREKDEEGRAADRGLEQAAGELQDVYLNEEE